MPLSTDVNLPKGHTPRFPDKCVVCRSASPTSTVRVMTGSIGWWTWLLWTFGKPHVVKAPACRQCGWLLHCQRLLSLVSTLLLIWIAFWVLWPQVEGQVSPSLRKYAMMGLGLLCLAPQLIYELFYPRPFDITAYANSVDYEFRDENSALEFANLNTDADWIKIN